MANDKLDELEQKKQELEQELERIQGELDDSIDRVRTDVTSKLDPVTFIKKHPLPVVGFSVLVGFLAGHDGKRRITDGRSGDDTSTMLWSELKRVATKKAISLASDYLEQILAENKGSISSNTPSDNGSAPDNS